MCGPVAGGQRTGHAVKSARPVVVSGVGGYRVDAAADLDLLHFGISGDSAYSAMSQQISSSHFASRERIPAMRFILSWSASSGCSSSHKHGLILGQHIVAILRGTAVSLFDGVRPLCSGGGDRASGGLSRRLASGGAARTRSPRGGTTWPRPASPATWPAPGRRAGRSAGRSPRPFGLGLAAVLGDGLDAGAVVQLEQRHSISSGGKPFP